MCLLVVAWHAHPNYRLVVAANRDEFHARPAAPLDFWRDPPPILAGRDLQAGGTWLGLDRDRRFGVVTNFRELARPRRHAPSRGHLITRYLAGTAPAAAYLEELETDAPGYAGFNLLLADNRQLYYASNRAERFATPLAAGVYGLSNHFLDTPWPKLRRVRAAIENWAASGTQELTPLWDALADTEPANDPLLDPALTAGLDPSWLRVLSAPFVLHPDYGTRCSTLLLIGHDDSVLIIERRFDSAGRETGRSEFSLPSGHWGP
ncbi:MAG: NRDE family protein [Steroidobacteraceae bacterium]|nr:NRDE family protein [Steroidobacteraceae bacterium]MDW8259537.1 NRDE family protein [Gammaproteobacteria bacterium]